MRVVALLIALACAGCISVQSGRPIDEAQVAKFQRGVTSYEEVTQVMGPPTSTSTINGDRVIIYSYTNSTDAGYAPFVGAVPSMANTRFQTASFTFGPNGILKDLTTSTNGPMTTTTCYGVLGCSK
jgi:outer membrane protein assembly factor BamE (lipoprotein component of BamABCDE complex)